ncbi:MAG: alpha/beta fold hydrolase [Rhodobacteraceae bacterium]|nr:alpha/beta fold hydrolase [Paracoccaceae bacterium]
MQTVKKKAAEHAIALYEGAFHTQQINGLGIRIYSRRADSAAPPLLICNGLGQSVETLFPLIEQFRDREIVAFDVPGVGHSDIPENRLSIPEYARITAQIMEQLGHDIYDVLGISWGGALAQQLAHDYPDRCRKLVLSISSAGGPGSWWGSPIAQFEIFFPLRYTSKTYGNMIGPWMYGGEAIFQPEMFKEYAKHAIAPSAEGYFGQVQAICSWTSLPWLHNLKQPTQVIAGAFDALIPIANQLLLASRLPNARLKVYQDGHLLMYSLREEVGNLMVSFLDEVGAR